MRDDKRESKAFRSPQERWQSCHVFKYYERSFVIGILTHFMSCMDFAWNICEKKTLINHTKGIFEIRSQKAEPERSEKVKSNWSCHRRLRKIFVGLLKGFFRFYSSIYFQSTRHLPFSSSWFFSSFSDSIKQNRQVEALQIASRSPPSSPSHLMGFIVIIKTFFLLLQHRPTGNANVSTLFSVGCVAAELLIAFITLSDTLNSRSWVWNP